MAVLSSHNELVKAESSIPILILMLVSGAIGPGYSGELPDSRKQEKTTGFILASLHSARAKVQRLMACLAPSRPNVFALNGFDTAPSIISLR